MAQRCQLTGKGVSTGNNVSHSNRKTKRTFVPNLHKKTVMKVDGQPVKMRVSAKAIKTLAKWQSEGKVNLFA